jgi:hypothetical protein
MSIDNVNQWLQFWGFFVLFCLLVGLGFELQSILFWFFFWRRDLVKWGLLKYLPELAWNHDPSDLGLIRLQV